MKNIYFQLIYSFLLLISFETFAQQIYVSQEWNNYTQSVGEINRTVSELDDSQNLIVVSSKAVSNGTTDVLVTKYHRSGTLLWQETYNGVGNGNDYGVQVTTNGNEDIFIAATIFTTSGMEFGLLKYNASGVLQWDATWAGPTIGGVSIPADLILDASGNIYLGGGTQAANGFSDYAIVKFNSSGTVQWDSTYDYADLHDAATGIALYNSKVVVTGASASTATNWDYATVDFLQSDGSFVGEKRSVVAGVGLDNAVAITTDSDNNIYVTGYVEVNGNRNIQTVKIDEDFGLEWVRTFNGGLEDVARAIGLDNLGNVYVTGYTEKPGGEIVMITIKYDEDGNDIWSKKYFANDGTDARAEKLIVSVDGGIIIAGTVQKTDSKYFTTLKYDALGNLNFLKEYNSGNGDDVAETMSVLGNEIYVSGSTTNEDSTIVSTVKYSVNEKPFSTEYDSNGNPYLKDIVLIRFNSSIVNAETIDRKEYTSGPLSKFISQSVIDEMTFNTGLNCGDLNTYKIYRRMTTADSLSITRLGNIIEVDDYWATLSILLPKDEDDDLIINNLEAMDDIVYCERDYIGNFLSVPDDDLYSSNQTGLYDPVSGINLEEAWSEEVGQQYVKIGVYESAVNLLHEDFGGATEETLEDCKITGGHDFYHDADVYDFFTLPLPNDPYWNHGTGVMGVIGAQRNNDLGIAGVAGGDDAVGNEGCSLYYMGIGLLTTTPNGVVYSTASEAIIEGTMDSPNTEYGFGLHVQNHSWGGSAPNSELRDAVKECWRNESSFIAGSGNDGAFSAQYPASFSSHHVTRVGGSDLTGDISPGSSYGVGQDVIAPGLSSLSSTLDGWDNSGYTYSLGGTSLAAALVSGVAGLIYSQHNIENPEYSYPNNLSTDDVEHILNVTAIDQLPVGYDIENGHGRVDAGAAMQMIIPGKYVKHKGDAYISSTIIETEYDQTITVPYPWVEVPTGSYTADLHGIELEFYDEFEEEEIIIGDWIRRSGGVSAGPNTFYTGTTGMVYESVIVDNTAAVTIKLYCWHVTEDSEGNPMDVWMPDTPENLKAAYSLHVEHTEITSLEEIDENPIHIEVYPNPSSGVFNINIDLNNRNYKTDININLYNHLGETVKSLNLGKDQFYQKSVALDCSDLSNGLYSLQLRSGEFVRTKLIAKKN